MRDIGVTIVLRLQALVAKGYRPELGIEGCEFIHLRHPREAPELMLWGDGQLLNAYPSFIKNEADRIIIELDDQDGMNRFLATVPKPTLFQRAIATSVADVAVGAMALALLFLLGWFGKLVFQTIFGWR
jgi:hypothetical protein